MEAEVEPPILDTRWSADQQQLLFNKTGLDIMLSADQQLHNKTGLDTKGQLINS
jgi:hypothetical protein